MRTDRWLDLGWLVLVAGLSSAWCATAGRHVGPTFDEPVYVRHGLEYWRTGSGKQLMTWGVMPLPVDAVTLPVYVWEQWRGEPFNPVTDLPEILPVARLATLPFWWLLLCYAMLWGRRLGGPWAGRVAVALIGTDPNFLGHAALATTDICLTAMVLMTVYHFHGNRESTWPRRVLLPGVLYGIALTAKASALPYVPLLALTVGLHHLWAAGRREGLWVGSFLDRVRFLRVATRRLRWDVVYVFAVGIVWAFAYVGCDWSVEPTFVDWAEKLPAGPARDVLVPVSHHLRIFPNAGEPLVQQIKHNIRGHGGSYLLGVYHPHPVPYYYPVALTVKLPDATLVLLAVTVLCRGRAFLRSPAAWAAALLLAFSLTTRVQIGIRLTFPMVAFSLIAVAGVLAMPGRGRGWLLGLSLLAAGSNFADAVRVWPDGVRYVNRLFGGPANGANLLAESNFDWGQGVPELRAWWAANGEPRVGVWYYGGDPAPFFAPFRIVHAHELPRPEAGAAAVGGPFAGLNPSLRAVTARAVGDGYLAVSVGLLKACPNRQPDVLDLIDWLNSLEPVGRTPLFVVFRLPQQ